MDFDVYIQNLDGAVDRMTQYHERLGMWNMQNRTNDIPTRFIYDIPSFDELIQCEMWTNLPDDRIRQYALHRWYNAKASKVVEDIFCEYGAERATRYQNIHEHIDIYINQTPFDIKVSNFPRNLNGRNRDYSKRVNRNYLIKNLYNDQSRDDSSRFCTNNRLFIVCKGANYSDNLRLKQNFEQMELKIKAYMEYLERYNYDINSLEVPNARENRLEQVFSEAIIINPEYENLRVILEEEQCPDCGHSYEMSVARNEMFRGNFLLKCSNPKCHYYINI